MWWNIKLCWN